MAIPILARRCIHIETTPRSIPWLLMPWLLASPWHQQPWYWIYRTNKSLTFMRQVFNYLHHPWFKELQKMKNTLLCFLKNKFNMRLVEVPSYDDVLRQVPHEEYNRVCHPAAIAGATILVPCHVMTMSLQWLNFNTLRSWGNGQHFADNIFKCIFFNENAWILIKISLKFVPMGPINNTPALVQIMDWRWPGNKPLSEPMMVNIPTHIYASLVLN